MSSFTTTEHSIAIAHPGAADKPNAAWECSRVDDSRAMHPRVRVGRMVDATADVVANRSAWKPDSAKHNLVETTPAKA